MTAALDKIGQANCLNIDQQSDQGLQVNCIKNLTTKAG